MNFKTGQRVRKVANRRDGDFHRGQRAHLGAPIGEFGTVVGWSALFAEWEVDWDSGLKVTVMPYMIEPIRDDDSNTVVSWSQCAWKPKQVHA